MQENARWSALVLSVLLHYAERFFDHFDGKETTFFDRVETRFLSFSKGQVRRFLRETPRDTVVACHAGKRSAFHMHMI
jgi:hypothetical protein